MSEFSLLPQTLPPQTLPPLTLVLGGQRSGKSDYAESLFDGRAVYIATAKAGGDEMAARILAHKNRRGPAWTTIEEPLDLAGALRRAAEMSAPVLVDCLTLWLSNMMGAGRDVVAGTDTLLTGLDNLGVPVVMVSTEVGGGIIPMEELSRRFVDAAGALHRSVAMVADCVVVVTAGIPVIIKAP